MPTNFIILMIFTVSFSYIVCSIVARVTGEKNYEIVLVAVCLTAGITLALTLYACCASDFTICGAMIALFVMMVMMFMLVLALFWAV